MQNLYFIADCGSPPQAGNNSVIRPYFGTTYLSTVTYVCKKFYETSESLVLVCQADRKWNRTLGPHCKGTKLISI